MTDNEYLQKFLNELKEVAAKYSITMVAVGGLITPNGLLVQSTAAGFDDVVEFLVNKIKINDIDMDFMAVDNGKSDERHTMPLEVIYTDKSNATH